MGGAEAHSRAVCRLLAASGHEVTVATTDALDFAYFWDPSAASLPAPAEDWFDGVRVLRFPVRHAPLSRLSYPGIRRLMSLLSAAEPVPAGVLRALCRLTPWVPALERWLAGDAGGFDLVSGATICFESLLLAGQRHARRHRLPFVVYPFTHLGSGDPRRHPVARYYTMRHQVELVRTSDAVMAMTETEGRFYVEAGADPAAVVVAGAAIDPADLAGGDAGRFRARHGLDGPIVYFLGTMSYDKGVPHLIEAMQRLWCSGTTAHLVLAGTVLEPVRRLIEGLDGESRSRLLLLEQASEEDKRDLLAAGDVFAMPSRTDSFGIVYLEAWLYGTPVIGAPAGGVPDVIEHGRDGLLVEFGDVEALASSLRRLLDDAGLAAALGEAGRRKVLERHTWEHKARLIEGLYRRLTERNPGAHPASGTPIPS